jgi:hypothetical protein
MDSLAANKNKVAHPDLIMTRQGAFDKRLAMRQTWLKDAV